jgi:hypothetical protein
MWFAVVNAGVEVVPKDLDREITPHAGDVSLRASGSAA